MVRLVRGQPQMVADIRLSISLHGFTIFVPGFDCDSNGVGSLGIGPAIGALSRPLFGLGGFLASQNRLQKKTGTLVRTSQLEDLVGDLGRDWECPFLRIRAGRLTCLMGGLSLAFPFPFCCRAVKISLRGLNRCSVFIGILAACCSAMSSLSTQYSELDVEVPSGAERSERRHQRNQISFKQLEAVHFHCLKWGNQVFTNLQFGRCVCVLVFFPIGV